MIARGFRALVVGFDWSLLHRGTAAEEAHLAEIGSMMRKSGSIA